MSFTFSREPIPARFVGDANSHTVILKIAVRAGMDFNLPTKRELENKIASDLLHMKRLDEGAAWDVASVIIPDPPNVQALPELVHELEQYLQTVLANSELRGARDRIFMIEETLRELLGLEST